MERSPSSGFVSFVRLIFQQPLPRSPQHNPSAVPSGRKNGGYGGSSESYPASIDHLRSLLPPPPEDTEPCWVTGEEHPALGGTAFLFLFLFKVSTLPAEERSSLKPLVLLHSVFQRQTLGNDNLQEERPQSLCPSLSSFVLLIGLTLSLVSCGAWICAIKW